MGPQTMKAANPDPAWLPVAEKRCDACLFSSARIVDKERADKIIEECRRDGTAFVCHKYTVAGEYGICRAFFDRRESLVIHLGIELNRVRFIPLPE